MRITYDPEVDILMVLLGDVSRRGDGTIKLPSGDAVADVATDGTILAIEIKGASAKYPITELQQLPGEGAEPMDLEDAAELADVSTQALRKAIDRDRLKADKVHGRWIITTTALQQYLASRVHEGAYDRPRPTKAVPHHRSSSAGAG